MSRAALVRHPATPCEALERVEAELGADERGAARLRYVMIGDAGRVIAAPPAAGAEARHRDELWRRTCCELFVRDAAGNGYREYNFAPSGDWAAYRFTGYRAGRAAFETAAPRIELERLHSGLALTVTLTEQPFDALGARRIAIACIVETPAGLSYWALAHAPGRPDFHDPIGFVAVPALERPSDLAG